MLLCIFCHWLFPAYAGVILLKWTSGAVLSTFPRICGGDPYTDDADQEYAALFPAYAGVIPSRFSRKTKESTFPRICGGDPRIDSKDAEQDNFSPHMRG